MANPSTGFGGAGTEVLRRAYVDAFSNSETTLLTGVANHIYTVLSVIIDNRNATANSFHLYVDADNAGTNIYLTNTTAIGSTDTFVFSDRFVLTETDRLHATLASAGEADAWVSYIDQQLA